MSFDYFIIVVKNNWSWLLEFYDGVYEIQLSTIREDVVSVGGNVCYGNIIIGVIIPIFNMKPKSLHEINVNGLLRRSNKLVCEVFLL